MIIIILINFLSLSLCQMIWLMTWRTSTLKTLVMMKAGRLRTRWRLRRSRMTANSPSPNTQVAPRFRFKLSLSDTFRLLNL